MGCSNSSSAGGCRGTAKDTSKDTSDDTTSQDEKHRNYGGVYVGLPTDASMSSSSKEAQVAAPSQSHAQNTKPGSPLPENMC